MYMYTPITYTFQSSNSVPDAQLPSMLAYTHKREGGGERERERSNICMGFGRLSIVLQRMIYHNVFIM